MYKVSSPRFFTSEGKEHSNFVGYKNNSSESFIRLYRKRSDGYIELVLDRTPFYAESGGQIGDKGLISSREFIFDLSFCK